MCNMIKQCLLCEYRRTERHGQLIGELLDVIFIKVSYVGTGSSSRPDLSPVHSELVCVGVC